MVLTRLFLRPIVGALSAITVAFLAFVPVFCSEPTKDSPELYVLAVQIDSEVFAKGQMPNSREAKLLDRLVTERSNSFYSKTHTRVLTVEQANRDNIMKALGWLEDKVRKQDVAVVFLAGHGSFNTVTNAYTYYPLGKPIRGQELRTAFDKIPGRNVLLLQMCNAKGILKSVDGDEQPFRNTIVVSACDYDQQANKLMGMVMVNGLAGLAADKDGTVTTKSLSHFLEQRVRTESGGKQSLSVSRPMQFADFPLALKGKPIDESMLDPKKEIQGEWAMVSLEQNGKKIDDVGEYKLTIKEDQWIVSFDGRESAKRTFRIDASKYPRILDFVSKSGDREFVSPGIYRLDDDKLTLCRSTKDSRPKEFIIRDTADILVVWKRTKK